MKNIFLASAATVLANCFIAAQTNPPCGAILTQNTVLTADCNCGGFAGTAFTIGADSITLDLNGFTLTAGDDQTAVMIAGRTGITIKSTANDGAISGGRTAILLDNTNANITISDINLSWTGNNTPTGNGIQIQSGSAVNGLTFDNITINNRSDALYFMQGTQRTNVEIKNSNFDSNPVGMYLTDISGLTLTNVSAQNNSFAVMLLGISGTTSISGVNISGSENGVYINDQNGFSITPGMFIGFGSTITPVIMYGINSNILISGVDLSWSGNNTPTGNGIGFENLGSVNGMSFDSVKINNRYSGIDFRPGNQSSNVEITNSNFDSNSFGMYLADISGLTLTNVSAQNNSLTAALFGGITGTISISGVNVTGSGTGVYFAGQNGFTITPSMFTGFGSTNSPIFMGYTNYDISLLGVDLSWTGSNAPTGNGIGFEFQYSGAVNGLTFDSVTINNRYIGLDFYAGNQSTDVEIINSNFDSNSIGLDLADISGLTLYGNTISNNQTGLNLNSITNLNIFHNNIFNNSIVNISGDDAYELWNHSTNEGNYWGHACPNPFISADANRSDIKDDFAYGVQSGWLLPIGSSGAKPCNAPAPGSACANAIFLTPSNTCNPTDFTMSDTVMWFGFVADSSDMRISVLPPETLSDTPFANIQTVKLYFGDCNGLTTLDSLNFSLLFNIFDISGAVPGTTYYLRIITSSYASSFFSLCVKNRVPILNQNPLSCLGTLSCDLICNGNFEDYNDCPQGLSEFPSYTGYGYNNTVMSWLSPTDATVDYFACGSISGGVPNNFVGCQTDVAPDENYAGIVLKEENYTEYIQQEMISAMIAGKTYFVQMDVSLAEWTNNLYADGIEVYFSTSQITANNQTHLPVSASLKLTSPTLLNDESTWVRICGIYTASGGEQWITIGNFGGIVINNGVIPSTCSSTIAVSESAYYYVDDVSVLPLPLLVNTSVCANSQIGSHCSFPTGATYSWLPTTGLSCATCPNPIANPTTTTTYTLTVTFGNGCSATSQVTVYPAPTANAGNDVPTCSNVPVSIGGSPTVSGGISPYNYQWTPTNGLSSSTVANPTVILLNGGTSPVTQTYTVSVTDAIGCTDEESVTITVDPPISITFTTTNTNCGITGTGIATVIITGGSSPFSYSWSNGQTGATATGLNAGNFSVTVTDALGCTATANVTINEYPLPNAPLFSGFFNNNCGNGGIATYSVLSPICPACYTWSVTINGNTTIYSGTTLTVNWSSILPTETGSVTLTVTDANGCTNSTTLTVFPCCILPPSTPAKPGIDYYFSNINCASTIAYVGKGILINGTYTICPGATVTFDGCKVFFGPDAKIIISNNATLKCTTSTIQTILKAGCDYMWDGIYLETNTATLTVKSSNVSLPVIIQDAKNAVVSKNGGEYSIVKTKFDLNLKSIVQLTDASQTEEINGDEFLCSGPMKPYWEDNTPNTAPRSIVHIDLTDVPNILIGNTHSSNTFKNAENGIICRNSTVNIYKNSFIDFTRVNNDLFTGNAILAVNTTLTVGGNAAKKNTFTNCASGCSTGCGVFAFFPLNTVISANDFTRMEDGVLILNLFSPGANRTVDILGNTMNGYRFGITVLNMPLCTLKINGNTLNQINSAYPDFKTGTGITVWNTFPGAAALTPEIKDNTIDGYVGSYVDIWTRSVRNALIKGNVITKKQTNYSVNATPNITFYGIRAEGCANAQISNNAVQRPNSTAFTNFTLYPNLDKKILGISIENSANCKVAKNTLTRMGSGIHATGACTNSKLYCNTLDNCYNGFFLNNASIGNQGYDAAPKPGPSGLTSDNVWTDLAGGVGDRILYQIPLTDPITKWYYRTTWFNNNPPSAFNPNNGASIGVQFPLLGQLQALPSSGIPGCNIQLKNLTPQEREELFGGIVRNEKIFANHEPEFKQWEKEMADRELKESGWLQLGSPDDALFQNFVDSIQLSNTGKLDEVRIAIEQNDLVLAESKNSAITPTHLIEDNRKTVNDIYVKAAIQNKTEWDAMETATLESIACQDPLEGGEAVYSARVMLRKEITCQPLARMANTNEGDENTSFQNLVKNNSFEQYTACPDTNGQIYYVKNWIEAGPSSCFPDYFNVCGSGQAGVPNNFVGYQQTQDGFGYIGIVPYVYAPPITNGREFAEGELNTPLEQGKKYCIEFYVSLTLNQFCNYAINSIGCLLSSDSFYRIDCQQETFLIPQIENMVGVISDTMNWVLISGEFIANGGEKFLTIGNFRNDSNTTVVLFGDTANKYGNSYYYIDNVSLTQCDVGVEEKTTNGNWQLAVYPNPASGSLTVTAKGGDEIIITDITGRKIKEYKISTNQLKINTDEFDDGIYFLTLYSGQRLVATEKLCVAK